jgi:hypothetical protein
MVYIEFVVFLKRLAVEGCRRDRGAAAGGGRLAAGAVRDASAQVLREFDG